MQKQTIWSKQNIGVLQRAQRDLEAKKEEEDEIAKSKYVPWSCYIVVALQLIIT